MTTLKIILNKKLTFHPNKLVKEEQISPQKSRRKGDNMTEAEIN